MNKGAEKPKCNVIKGGHRGSGGAAQAQSASYQLALKS